MAASRKLAPRLADFGGGMRKQARDLGFEGARAHDLAKRGIGGERQKIPRNVECACVQGPLVGLRFQPFGRATRWRSSSSTAALMLW